MRAKRRAREKPLPPARIRSFSHIFRILVRHAPRTVDDDDVHNITYQPRARRQQTLKFIFFFVFVYMHKSGSVSAPWLCRRRCRFSHIFCWCRATRENWRDQKSHTHSDALYVFTLLIKTCVSPAAHDQKRGVRGVRMQKLYSRVNIANENIIRKTYREANL